MDLDPPTGRNDNDLVTIKVSTRKTLRNFRIDANSIPNVLSENGNSRRVFIVDSKNRDLKSTAMRVSNKSHLFAVTIVWSKDLSLLHRIKRQDNLCALTRECSRFQMDSSRVALIGEVEQKLSLNRGVRQRTDLRELIGSIGISQIQLLVDKLDRLLRKELGRKVFAHLVPVTLFFQLIDCGELLIAVSVDVVTLAVGLNQGSEGVVGIILNFLQNIHLRCSGMLVGVEDNVRTIGHIVGVHRHSFKVVSTIDKDANLSIVRIPKVKVGNATTDLNDTVFQCAAFIAIEDLHTAGVNTRRILTLVPGLAAIGRMIVTNGLHQIKVLINLSLVDLRNGNDGCDGALLRVVDLRNANTISVVTLSFQNEKSLLKDTGRNAKLSLNTGANINGSFFRKFFL